MLHGNVTQINEKGEDMLTDERIDELAEEHTIGGRQAYGVYPHDFARAIEAEVLGKQEPVMYYCNKCGYHGTSSEHHRPNTNKKCGYFACASPQPCSKCVELESKLAARARDAVAVVERRFVHGAWCCFIHKTPTTLDLPDGTRLFVEPYSQAESVSPTAHPDEMNTLHGEAYGIDWSYPPSLTEYEKLQAKVAELESELADCTASNKAVEAALSSVPYKGPYAAGVEYLKSELAILRKNALPQTNYIPRGTL